MPTPELTLRNQKIRLVTGQLIVLDVVRLHPRGDYTPGVAYLDECELELEQFDCCVNGEQWIESGVRECLTIWAQNQRAALETEITGLVWDPENKCWMADLVVDGDDVGLTFFFDDACDMHVRQVYPHTIVVHF